MEDRFVKLESNFVQLERYYEQLNEVVVEQGKLLARLQAQQKQVSATLEAQELERIKANSTKPPHYQ